MGDATTDTAGNVRIAFPLLILTLCVIVTAMSIRTHRMPGASAATRWGTRTSVLLMTSIAIGQIAALFFPDSSPVRLTASAIGFLFVLAAVVTIRHTNRANTAAMKQVREDRAKMHAAGR